MSQMNLNGTNSRVVLPISPIRRRLLVGVASAAACALTSTHAATQEVLIGRTADYSGVASPIGLAQLSGAKVALAKVNAAGGVKGRSIRLDELDDAFNPGKAAANAKLLADRGALSLFMVQGTSQTLEILKAVRDSHIPIVAPFTGANAIYQHDYPSLFRVRASYDQEIAALVRHFGTIGWNKIAVFSANNDFGVGMTRAVQSAMSAVGTMPVGVVSAALDGSDTLVAVNKVLALDAQVVLVTSFGASATQFIERYRKAGGRSQIATVSLFTQQQIQSLDRSAVGLMVSQVMPLPAETKHPLVREFLADAEKFGNSVVPSALSLEGYVAAQFLIDGLKRCKDLGSRAEASRAFAATRNLKVGNLLLDLSNGRQAASSFVDIVVVDSGLKFRR